MLFRLTARSFREYAGSEMDELKVFLPPAICRDKVADKGGRSPSKPTNVVTSDLTQARRGGLSWAFVSCGNETPHP